MSNERETIKDISKEIRADKKPYALKVARELKKCTIGDKVLLSDAEQCLRDDSKYIKELASRMDAAYDRMQVASNAVVYKGKMYYEQRRCGKMPHGMAVQDALSDLVAVLEFVHEKQQKLECINLSLALAYQRAKKALKYPPRNCDIGSVTEQTARLRKICNAHKPSCKGCPCFGDIQKENCWLTWAQMPYTTEQKKEGEDK